MWLYIDLKVGVVLLVWMGFVVGLVIFMVVLVLIVLWMVVVVMLLVSCLLCVLEGLVVSYCDGDFSILLVVDCCDELGELIFMYNVLG